MGITRVHTNITRLHRSITRLHRGITIIHSSAARWRRRRIGNPVHAVFIKEVGDNPHFQNSDLTQTGSDVIPRGIIPDTSSGDDSLNRNQTVFGGDSLNQGKTASDDLSPSRLPNSVDSSLPSRAAAVAGRERVKSWARKLNMS